jgi:hypothetical protein
MMLLASLFAAPVGGAEDAAVCQAMPSHSTHAAHAAHATHATHAIHAIHVEGVSAEWRPERQEIRVQSLGSVRTVGVASVRVLGRCVVKAAPKNAQPVLFGSFAAQIDDPDDENLASTRAEARAPYPGPAAVGAGPTEMYVLRTPLTLLERPPRV